MPNPAVTVLVDTYNHERFIEEALVSVVEQDFPASEMEILVVDDGSTDRTPEIIRKFAPRVRYLRKSNGGQASAFNFGIPEARGEIVAFLDADDWWARNKLARVVEAMAADPEVGIVGHGIVIVHRDGSRQLELLREGFRFRANTIEGANLFRRRKSLLGTSRMTIRRELLQRIGPVPDAIRVQADEYLFTLSAALGNVQILEEPLTFYRMHDANGYQLSACDSDALRKKQRALAALAECLTRQLNREGTDPQAARTITEIIHAEADQARLLADGGWPWELVRTEAKIFGVVFADASRLRWALKILGLIPGIAMPPRTYYRFRQRLGQSHLYNRLRRRWLPFPQAAHVGRTPRIG
jgi:cellulose synthase/poly-beta-1,6-N-acetylglucosamine synthase-like glycosyltransferase